jgi:hypothetical protein
VERTATELGQAIFAGDRARYLDRTVTYDQLRAILDKDLGASEFAKAANAFFDEAAGDAAELLAADAAVSVTSAQIIRSETYSSDKLATPLDVAIVQLVIRRGDEERVGGWPLAFLRTDAGWRFWPKK